MNEKDLSRFLDYVDIPEDASEYVCWNWRGYSIAGYGRFYLSGKPVLAHRAMYLHCFGKIPDSYVVHHLCNNRSCVNPLHLRAVTQRDNVKSSSHLRFVTHCPKGHKMAGENIYFYYRTDGRATRRCRQCVLDYKERRRADGTT